MRLTIALPVIRSLSAALILALVGCASHLPSDGSDSASRRLVLHDFDDPVIINKLGGKTVPWKSGPAGTTAEIGFVPSGGTDGGGGALRIAYTFDPCCPSTAGARTFLNGLDASKFDHMEFRVRGDPEAGFPTALEAGFLRPEGRRQGMLQSGSIVVGDLTGDWRRVTVPLNAMSGIDTWTDLQEFRVTLDSRRPGPARGAVVIDDVALLKTGKPGPSAGDPVLSQRKRAWEKAIGGPEAMQRQIHARLTGWPARALAGEDLPKDDHAFLLRVARDTWTGLRALTDREHGLPLDRVAFAGASVAPDLARIGDYTGVTDIGLYLMSIVAANELGFIGSADAVAALHTTISTLEQLETYRGFFYNFYDTTTLERTSNFVSTLDSSWLVAGMMVVRSAFPQFAPRLTTLIDRMDFRWLYDDVEEQLYHGYFVNLKAPSQYHYGLLYTEARLASLIAIGKGDVPEEHWFRLARTLDPKVYPWQSMMPVSRTQKTIDSIAFTGGYYQKGPDRYVPSWGGSMFEALMPTLVVDEQTFAPLSLGLNNRRHTQLQLRYALEDLGYPVWGMSPSSSFQGSGYSEYGVPALGSAGYKVGVVTPHASALALVTDPQAAIANLRQLARKYPVYGEFGFYDAVDPLSGRVAYKYLALDQAMIFLAVTNYLKHGIIQRLFAADPVAARALPIIGKENFFE